RISLLEADVALPVVRGVLARLKETLLGDKAVKSTSPSETFTKAVHDEIISILGKETKTLSLEKKPSVVLFVGLQGVGKTTSLAKLAYHLKTKGNKKVLVASADIYRAAAQEQLQTLVKSIDVDMFLISKEMTPEQITKAAFKEAKDYDVLLFDTAGRTHLDAKMMAEAQKISKILSPQNTLFIADAMQGQASLSIAEAFHEKLNLTGMLLTRLDGDARGGVALSVSETLHIPILFIGVGEKIDDFDVFHPQRMASRILGMGDVVSLVEKAQSKMDMGEVQSLTEKMFSGNFDLNDMLAQIRQMKKMGSMKKLLKFLPGMGGLTEKLDSAGMNDNAVKYQEAILLSMTNKERLNPEILLASRKQRIAKGAGRPVSEIEKLLKNHLKMKKMMAKMQDAGGLQEMMKNMPQDMNGMDLGEMDPSKLLKK
ncbi:MAG: signal recognition particle protein, partial [Alphaproteobacteria bacterium]